MDALAPFVPSDATPWDAAAAAHLARRAGFGAHDAELARLVELGPQGAFEHLLGDAAAEQELAAALTALGPELDVERDGPGAYGPESLQRLRRWWLVRCVETRAPLREKLALFWHDRFACQQSVVVRVHMMRQQNQLFRRLGAGSFRELVRAVARDPAMLVFLDNRVSTAVRPNENWARELMELFTLGVDRYTQADVRELARVFTGWTTPRLDSPQFVFDPQLHDTGDKQVLGAAIRGRSGPAGIEEGDEAIDVLLAQPACAPFVAHELVAWFACDEPPPDVVAAVAEVLRTSDWSIAAALRALLCSRWFHAPERRFAKVKNPLDLVVGAARAVGLANAHLFGLEQHTLALGLDLFEPPSVAGWDHGAAWTRTGSVAPRLNFALDLSEVAHAARRVTGRATCDVDRLAALAASDASEALVRALASRVLGRDLDDDQVAALAEVLDGLGPAPDDERARRDWRRLRVRVALHGALAAPQFALG